MPPHTLAAVLCAALPLAALADPDEQVKSLGVVVIGGARPTSLPTEIPTTIETITRPQIDATINATDAEDVLKYFPSLLVRKRYIGDYNHAVLSTRASGTGNSAHSLVYADGILLSNLLGNGATFTPRWGLVTPEEIERVDVLYGPFSAAYSGNSVGAVVDYVTRMPTAFEAHAKLSYFSQPFDLYGTHATYDGWQGSASLGNAQGGFAWWIDVNRSDSEGQPLTFATRYAANGTPGSAGVPVSGAVAGLDRSNQAWSLLGSGTQYHTVQDHLKLKLAYALTPELRASYTFGYWRNDGRGESQSYLRDASGAAVYSGPVNIGGLGYTGSSGVKAGLLASDFPLTRDGLEHLIHAVSLKSHTQGLFDWEVAASVYDYRRDLNRRSGTPLPAAEAGGAGSLSDQQGSGWNTLALKGIWRPQGLGGAHLFDAGVQQDSLHLRTSVYALADWLGGGADGQPSSRFDGNTKLQAVYAQDAWAFAEGWKAVLGLRAERWTARGGFTQSGSFGYAHPERAESDLSPKLALSHQLAEHWVLKASTGRAVRFPTVSELYQGAATANGISNIANPDLRPERSWTSELSTEWMPSDTSSLRATLFHEDTHDALYSQTGTNAAGALVTSVQNIDHVRTWGLETAGQAAGVLLAGLDLQGSITYADSRVVANSGYVSFPGDTIGKWQQRVPRWRASALATWRATERFSLAYGARYAGKQYSTADNSDPNGFAYMAASKYFITDVRLRFAMSKQWTAAFGVDNLNNCQYWNFHPYPQRTYSAELEFTL